MAGVAAGAIYKSSARISAGGTALPIKRVATTRHRAGGRHGGRQAKLVVYARVLGVAAAVGALVQAWGAASQRRPVGEGMDVGAVEEFGRGEQNVG